MGGLLILCPGQGSQTAGMAEYLCEYPTARKVFAEASEILGWDIEKLCRGGSMEELTRTDRTQLAILTCSVAVWRVLEEKGAGFSVAVGHSLGEYSALVATGHMAFADALRVVNVRGRAMQACAEKHGGTMAAVIGLQADVVEQICASLPEVWPANYNSPEQVVISGSAESVREAGDLALTAGAKRVLSLPVSGAFHTPFVADAAQELAEALSRVEFAPGRARFYSTTELFFPEASELTGVLTRQLTLPVKFAQSMEMLLSGSGALERGLEVGPGNVLAGLVKRIARGFPMAGTGDGEALRRAIDERVGIGGLA